MRKQYTALSILALFAATAAVRGQDSPRTVSVAENHHQLTEVDVVFIGGDCGIGNFGAKEAAKKVWDEHFGALKTIRLHIEGENWTSPKSTLTSCRAKVVVLMLGAKHLLIDRIDPPEVAKGIEATLNLVRESQPQAKVVLYGIALPPIPVLLNWPAGKHQELAKDLAAQSDQLVAKLADGKTVYFVDAVPKLAARSETINEALRNTKDVHDITVIWEALAESMDEAVRPLLKRN